MKRAVIYARISKDSEKRGEGVDRQRADCEALAKRLKARVVEEPFTDNDVGASTKGRAKPRPAYDRMLALVERGEVDLIVAYSNSRLTRRPMEFEGLIALHERTGVEIHTVVSGTDDLSTADGRMTARIKASVDAAESERISERTRRAKSERRKAGLPQDGRSRYGYRRVWTDGKVTGYVPDEDGGTAEVLRGLYRDYLNGAGLASLCRDLAERGVLSPTGKAWSTQTLSHTLSAGFAAGVIRELSTGDEAPGAHEAIISAEDWQAFKDLRRSKASSWREVPRARQGWLLSGIAKCGRCGKNLIQNRSRKGKAAQAFCSHYNSTRSCEGVWVKTERVEDVVWDCLSNVLLPEWSDAPLAAADDTTGAAADADRWSRESERLSGLLLKLERRRTEDDVDAATYRSLRAEYEAERAQAEERALEARSKVREVARDEVDWDAVLDRTFQPQSDVDVALHRANLARVLDRVEVHPAVVRVVSTRGGVVDYQR